MRLHIEHFLWEQYQQAVFAWQAEPDEINEKAAHAAWIQFYKAFVGNDYSGGVIH